MVARRPSSIHFLRPPFINLTLFVAVIFEHPERIRGKPVVVIAVKDDREFLPTRPG